MREEADLLTQWPTDGLGCMWRGGSVGGFGFLVALLAVTYDLAHYQERLGRIRCDKVANLG